MAAAVLAMPHPSEVIELACVAPKLQKVANAFDSARRQEDVYDRFDCCPSFCVGRERLGYMWTEHLHLRQWGALRPRARAVDTSHVKGRAMPKYLIERNMSGAGSLSREALTTFADRSCRALYEIGSDMS